MVYLVHKLQRARADGDDHIRLTILVFPDQETANSLLVGRIREKYCVQVFGVQLKMVGGTLQSGADSFIDNVDSRMRNTCLIQNQNPTDWLGLGCGSDLQE